MWAWGEGGAQKERAATGWDRIDGGQHMVLVGNAN